MKTYLMTFAIAFVVMGCAELHGRQPPVTNEKTAPQPDYHLKYKSWFGVSPGAGFTHTSLYYVEIDLAKNSIRRFWKSASCPDPMLPHDDSGIAKLITHVPWTELTFEQADTYRKSIGAWLETEPPPTYSSPMALGREDGHVTSITVTWGTNAVTTALNPHGGNGKDDTLHPPKEWKEMLDLLFESCKVPDKTSQPIRLQ